MPPPPFLFLPLECIPIASSKVSIFPVLFFKFPFLPILNMKILSWMQSKLNGKQATKKPNAVSSNHNKPPQAPCKEEFSDWPQALFSIGTFGNSTLKEEPEGLNPQDSQDLSCQDHLQGMSPEEIKELQKLLQDIPTDESESLNLETDCEEYSVNKDNNLLQKSGSLVFSRGTDIFLDNTNNTIGKRSLTFLLKKMFICSSGFSHGGPNLRDVLPEVKIEKSRMEKLLRALLHKKIYPRAMPKYLEQNNDDEIDDEMSGEGNDGSKWVKTDSEYIVLEI